MHRKALSLLVISLAVLLLAACGKTEVPSGSDSVAGIVGTWSGDIMDGNEETSVRLNLLENGRYTLYKTVKVNDVIDHEQTVSEQGSYTYDENSLTLVSDIEETTEVPYVIEGSSMTIELRGETLQLNKQ